MLAKNARVEDLDIFCLSDGWWLEQKLDGDRVLARVVDNEPQFLNRSGVVYGHRVPDPIRRAFAAGFSGEWVFDGELMDGVYWVFDMLHVGTSKVAESYAARRELLEALFGVWEARPDCVRLVPTARTEREKRDLVRSVLSSNAEGVIAKWNAAPYNGGRRNDSTLKVKLVATADVIVTEVGRQGKDSIAIGIVQDGALVDAGAVNMQGKPYRHLQIGQVVEVRYLYVVAGSTRLVQPEFIRVRTDKPAEQCTTDQLKFTNREVLA